MNSAPTCPAPLPVQSSYSAEPSGHHIPDDDRTLTAIRKPSAATCQALNWKRTNRHPLDDDSKARLVRLQRDVNGLRPIDKIVCLLYLDGLDHREVADVLASRRPTRPPPGAPKTSAVETPGQKP